MVFISKYINVGYSKCMYVMTTQVYVYSLCTQGKMLGHRDVYGVVVGSAKWALRPTRQSVMNHVKFTFGRRIAKG